MGFRKVLGTLLNLENLELCRLVKLGDNPSTNRIRIHPELRSCLAG
jgi:hypothetical protein